MVRTSNGTDTETAEAVTMPAGPHDFRIDWTATGFVYSIDGAVVDAQRPDHRDDGATGERRDGDGTAADRLDGAAHRDDRHVHVEGARRR